MTTNNPNLTQRIAQGLKDACYIWSKEMRLTFKDEGMLIFFIFVPLMYPLLYSWIYNNEVVREVPVAVVDLSNSALSRQFARQCDASPDVMVKCHAGSLEEAKALNAKGEVKGVIYFPEDFAKRINRMEQATVGIYCDMSLMLYYKAVYQTAQAVSAGINANIQTQLSGNYTKRQDELTTQPLAYDEVTIFNPQGGYGSFILPGVLILILQQTLVLGIGLSAGTARETNRYRNLIPISRHYQGVFRIVMGKAMCYFMIYAVMGAWLTVVVPRLFSFVTLARPWPLLALMVPLILACIFFGMTVSCLVRHRENVLLLVVFFSVPLMFMSGMSWPKSAIPGVWQGISWLFPSTFGVRAYIRMNSMGASLADVAMEYRALWIQAGIYFITACTVYRNQILRARIYALERLEKIRSRRKGKQ